MLVSASSFRARSFVRSQFAVGFIVLVLQCFPLHLDLRFEYILLPLPQATGSQMSLQKKEKGKQYLYVQQAGKQGLMIVDVSRPEEPCLLNRTAEANQATTGNLAIVSPDVAIAEAPDAAKARGIIANVTIKQAGRSERFGCARTKPFRGPGCR